MTIRQESRPALRRGPTIKADRLERRRHAGLQRLHAALRADLLDATSSPPVSIDGDDEREEVAVATVAELADDPLPEDAVYRDEGCSIARSCLRCPLAACIYDREGSPAQRGREGRDRIIRTLLGRGWPAARVAARFDLSAAQVRRIRGGPVAHPPGHPRRPLSRSLLQ